MLRTTLASAAVFALVAGCGAAQDGEDGELPDDVSVGQQSSALCTDAGAANYSAALGTAGGSLVARTSPSRTYGSAACQSLYVVEATQTQGKNFTISATWGEALPNTREACPFALLAGDAYGYRNGVWYNLGHKSATGQWGGFGNGSCSIGINWVLPSSTYSKVRVAAKAAALLIFTSSPRKVRGSVMIPWPPPA